MTDAAFAIMVIQEAQRELGLSIDDAARHFKIAYPLKCMRVLEDIGNWPSSEPELAALQRVK